MKIALIVLGLLASATAQADGSRLYAACAACHGTNGAGQGSALPVLAGQPRAQLTASMRAFRDGSRPSTIMQQITKGFTEAEIEAISAFLERQKAVK